MILNNVKRFVTAVTGLRARDRRTGRAGGGYGALTEE